MPGRKTAAALGSEWDDVFRKELKESSAFVALISDNWNHSPWAAMEYGAAYAMGKKIIPVVIDNTTNDDVAIDLNRFRSWMPRMKIWKPLPGKWK